MATSTPKKWGKGEFWGLNSEYDHDWILTENQKCLRDKLIELCRVKIRPNAIHCDRTYAFPRESLNAIAELGLLGLIAPKELGGLGENHVAAAMVVETLARYGCPSTAMVYTMHVGAVTSLLFRHHNNKLAQDVIKRLDKDKLVGTLAYSDPATGGHFWFPLSSKTRKLDENTVKLLKYGSWATSAGCADFYTIQVLSPECDGDYSNLSCFLVFKDEVRASTDDWSGLGMHGNQSGPIVIEGTFSFDRLIGPIGDGARSNAEIVTPYFCLLSSSCWNGLSMACLDIAKKHVTRKAHADFGIRVCDYPTIQDYFGDCLASTSISRSHIFMVAQLLDSVTNNNDWSLHSDVESLPSRVQYVHWLWICKYDSSKNTTHVSEKMFHACGGSGYKTDLGIERLLRDAKAAWVMAPSNEVLRLVIGNTALHGLSSVDFWEQRSNERVLHHELSKLTLADKKNLAQKLSEEVDQEEKGIQLSHPFQDTDFENPFNTSPPKYVGDTFIDGDAIAHTAALNPSKWTPLSLLSRRNVSKNMSSFVFNLPDKNSHTGCLPGQYVQMRVTIKGKHHDRYFSPVSKPYDFGRIELVLKFETQGIISNYFQTLKPGDKVEFIGPCGGFEYEPGKLEQLTLIAAGGGITPGLQLIRSILSDPSDKTKILLLYFSETYDDILYREELDSYAAKDSRLKIIHTLGEVSEAWDGEEGFIDTKLIDKYVPKPNAIKQKIIMCGGPTMTISCLYSLRILKFPSESIFIYGQLGTEQIRKVYGRNVRLSGHKCDNVV